MKFEKQKRYSVNGMVRARSAMERRKQDALKYNEAITIWRDGTGGIIPKDFDPAAYRANMIATYQRKLDIALAEIQTIASKLGEDSSTFEAELLAGKKSNRRPVKDIYAAHV